MHEIERFITAPCRDFAKKVLETLEEMQKIKRMPVRTAPLEPIETTQQIQRNLWKNSQRVHTSVRYTLAYTHPVFVIVTPLASVSMSPFPLPRPPAPRSSTSPAGARRASCWARRWRRPTDRRSTRRPSRLSGGGSRTCASWTWTESAFADRPSAAASTPDLHPIEHREVGNPCISKKKNAIIRV